MPATEQVPPEPETTGPELAGPPVSGQLSDAPLAENGWGYNDTLPVSYHDDGPIGTAVKYMRADAQMDIDGEPLANVLGKVATDVVYGRRTPQQGLEEYQAIRDRLPEGSQARTCLDFEIRRMDAPATPPPSLPEGTPEPLRKLVSELNAIPMVRRDPGTELEPLAQLSEQAAAGRTSNARLARAVMDLANRRHESLGDSGKFTIDRALRAAAKALDPRQAQR